MAIRSAIPKRGAAGPRRPPLFSRIKQFLIEAWLELQKVLWPSRQEAMRFTLVVLGVIAAIAVFIHIIDTILALVSAPLFNLGPER